MSEVEAYDGGWGSSTSVRRFKGFYNTKKIDSSSPLKNALCTPGVFLLPQYLGRSVGDYIGSLCLPTYLLLNMA